VTSTPRWADRPTPALSRVAWAVVGGWSLALTCVLLRPIAHAGYGLGRDLVFTPQQPLDAASVGLSSATPRAVPLDALVALAEQLLDGAIVFRLALAVPLLAAGIGVALALRPRHLSAALAGASFAIWNPYVVERLAIGHWALLWAHAALPWLVVAARQRWSCRAALTLVAVGAASITPTGGVIAAALALVLALVSPPQGTLRRSPAVLALAVVGPVLQLPWVLPALLSSARATSDPAAVDAFASRADVGPGSVGSLLTGAGIWNADVVPSSRQGWLGVVALGAVLGCALAGWRDLERRLQPRVLWSLAASAALGLGLAALAAVPGGGALLRAAVSSVPGAGLLRDGQKWVMPLVLLSSLLAGSAAGAAWSWLPARAWRVSAALAFALLPLLLLPDAAATISPTIRPVDYPAEWGAVRRLSSGGGDAVALPFAAYRSFTWAPGRPVLDPAPRLLAAPVVVDDRLSVSGRLLAGEDQRGRAVARVLSGSGNLAAGLARVGVRWVVVEHGTPGAIPELGSLEPVFAGSDVSLYRVPGVVTGQRTSAWRTAVVLTADVLCLALVLLGVGLLAGCLARRRHRRDAGTDRPPLLESPSLTD
jgi:hypothetical protein